MRRALCAAFLAAAAVAGCGSQHAATGAPGHPAGVTATGSGPAAEAPVVLSSSPAPQTTTPAPTPTPASTTPLPRVPPPAHPKPPPPPPAPAGCHPLTNGGKCYEPGEFCRTTDHGVVGLAGDGKVIVCENNDDWRWEPQ